MVLRGGREASCVAGRWIHGGFVPGEGERAVAVVEDIFGGGIYMSTLYDSIVVASGGWKTGMVDGMKGSVGQAELF